MSRTRRTVCSEGHDLTIEGRQVKNGAGRTITRCRVCSNSRNRRNRAGTIATVRGESWSSSDATARNTTHIDSHIPYMEPLPERITAAARSNLLTLWPDEAPETLLMLGLAS